MILTANVPEQARRVKGRKKNPRAVGPTMAAEVSFRIAADKLLGGVLGEARKQAPGLAQGITIELVKDSVAGVAILVQTLRLVQDVLAGDLRSALRRVFVQEEARHRRDFAAAVRAAAGPDVSLVMASADVISEVQLAIERSTALISGTADSVRQRAVTAIIQAGQEGTRTKDLASELSEIGGWSRKRSKLIARDQIATFNGTLNQVRQVQAGFDKYIWRTSLDERVRPLHAQREGKIFSWDDPPSDGAPGQAINCRCVAQAYLDL